MQYACIGVANVPVAVAATPTGSVTRTPEVAVEGDAVERMLEQVGAGEGRASPPPIGQWNPPLSGDMDLVIDIDGHWIHEGGEIRREALVRLFASILRYEEHNGYVLVTPVEKWRIRVEDAPFIATAMAQRNRNGRVVFCFATNVGDEVCADAQHPLQMVIRNGSPVPYIRIRDGLKARLSRPVFYELAEHAHANAGRHGVTSDGIFFPLQ